MILKFDVALARAPKRLTRRRRGGVRRIGQLTLVALLLSAGDFAEALIFHPSDAEWRGWTDYCRARYTVSGAGRNSKFAGAVPPATVKMWQRRLSGPWGGLHHYCAARIIYKRGMRAKTQQKRKANFDRVSAEVNFSIRHTPDGDPMMAEMFALKARALMELGNSKESFELLRKAIKLQPKNPNTYGVMAMLLRASGKNDEAKDWLRQGIKNADGNTAELQYFLGLILYKEGAFDTSLVHAKAAYEQGYPLPWLRDQLVRGGHWN